MVAVGLVVMIGLVVDVSHVDGAQKGKKGAPKKFKPPGDPKGDGNNVVGAIWRARAMHEETGEKKEFRFRVKDGVLYAIGGAKVGSMRPLKVDRQGAESEITWEAGLPLQGAFKITMNKVGHWAGVLTTSEGNWKVRLDVQDR
jgi:hypothetical protein